MINHPRELQGKVIYLSFTARRHGWPSQAGPRVGRVSLLEGVVVEEVDSVLDVKFTSSCFWPRCLASNSKKMVVSTTMMQRQRISTSFSKERKQIQVGKAYANLPHVRVHGLVSSMYV